MSSDNNPKHDAHVRRREAYIKMWNGLCDLWDSGHRERDDRREAVAGNAEYQEAQRREGGGR